MRKVEELHVYGHSLHLLYSIYELFNIEQKLSADFAIRNQIRRSALSIPLNIAEGFATTKRRFSYHLAIAIGSANETIVLLQICRNLYQVDIIHLENEYSILLKQLHAFKNKLSQEFPT